MIRNTLLNATLSIVCLLAAQSDARATDPPAPAAVVYQPAGAPADPKVPAQWNRYHTHAEITSFLQQLAAAHPDRCQLQSLGKSYGDRDMWLLTISNLKHGQLADKPTFWIDGGIHANEIQSVEVVLYTAWYLLEAYGRNPLVTRLLDERAFLLLPMLSPDSRDAHLQRPNTTHSPRGGQRPVDDDRYDSRDIEVLDVIGKRGAEILPGYRYINIANDLYEVYGGEVDWFYAMQGVFTFTNELFAGFNFFRKASEGFFGSDEDLHAFDRYLLFGGGMVPWHEVDHPLFGKVEVGGMTKNWVRQPPSFLLEEECHRNMAFTLYHADQMPQVEVQSIEAAPLPGGLTQVTAVIANRKVIPTHAAADVQHRITPPDRVTISGPAIDVVLGLKSTDRFFRSSDEQKRDPQSLEFRSIPGMQAVYGRWIVRGAGPYTVTVVSPKGGRAERTSEAPK